MTTFLQPRELTAEELACAQPDDPPFDPDDPDGSKREQAARDERIAGLKQHFSEVEEGKRQARAELEAAELSGQLSPEAEAFRDGRLKPRLAEIHAYEQKVRTPIVQGLLFRDTIAWVAGASGTFKSFVTADLAFRYGADEDMDYHGLRMTKGRVLLVIAEGAGGYADRRAAWEKEHGREVKNVVIYPAPLQLGDTLKEMPALLSYLKEEDEAGQPFGLIVFDTQAMCTVGIDENTSEVNLVINVLHRIREVSGACVLTVHHFGKTKGAGMRGSSMIYAAADTVIIIEREKQAMEITLGTGGEHGKQKDAPAEEKIKEFTLKPHTVGVDYFGDPLTSLVPVLADSASHDVHEAPDALPEYLPDVTVDQMFYLKLLAFYEGRGGTPSDMAAKLEEARGPMKNGRQNVRNRMIELAKMNPPLAAQPVAKGPWVITPMGTAVIARQLAVGDRWVELAGPRRQVSGQVSGGQRNLDSETSET
ncbi:MAG TPA: AAA family ATPase [Acidimicrobiia bacterium]|nr:AAA family ATPase [Acidimicrobiia bacterium]